MIRITDVQKSFNRNQVLKSVNLEITPGSTTAILGPNGSGKTTLLKSILGLVIPQKGEVYFNGKPTVGKWEHRKQIAYLPQVARFPENLKVNELIQLVKDIRESPGDERTLIERFSLEPFLNKSLRNLSGGTRQKVNVVLAFMYDNPLIILDEPTVGLDPVALIHLKELISREKAKGKTILLTTHIMSVVEELADEIVFLLEGKIYFQGSLTEMNALSQQADLEHSIAQILIKEAHV
ncbi:ABC transporter ATP-binding protein [Rapidithrix thailandica]|uniref:ABC transporter ATP-binding protein n=1 Tax=Rapidithrix thailandica TaxID=413964 RepID=A0AAW9RPS3_9BACT